MSFNIVVFGDSIQWGQGLRPATSGGPASDKMAEIVAISFTDAMVIRFAQSGATISPSGVSTVTAPTPFPSGEVPSSTPTIMDQASGASTSNTLPFPASSVGLVILDGGINDVGVFGTILNPTTSQATITALTSAACGTSMTTLLNSVGRTFPNAIVVVTGYYVILSSSSDTFGLVMAAGLLAGTIAPELLDPGGWLVTVLTGSLAAQAAAATVIGNCETFRMSSDTSLTAAVASANGNLPAFTAQGPSITSQCFFVPSTFQDDNALFTGGSNGDDKAESTAPAFLWGFNPGLDTIGAIVDADVGTGALIGSGVLSAIGSIIGETIFGPLGGLLGGLFGSNAGGAAGAAAAIVTIQGLLSPVDEVAAARAGACAGQGLGCMLASVGHPNIEGEAAYATGITNLLAEIGLIKAAGSCMIVTAALGTRHAEAAARLRRMRDDYLQRSRLGRDFYSVLSKDYYAFSPLIVDRMNASAEFRNRVRSLIVSPFLGFTDLLGSWMSGLPADAFQVVLAANLEASLGDLAKSGIASDRVPAVEMEISRLSARRSQGATPDRSDADRWRIEPADIVNYFNAVARGTVHSDGAHLDLAVLQPVKMYWRLLAKKAASTPMTSIRSDFQSGASDWLGRAAALASVSERSADDFGADLKLLSEVLSTKQSARDAFLVSLHSSGRGAGT